MTDPLIDLVKIACITLLITILWALTLTIAYLDIQRRKQAGQKSASLAWMVMVAFLPFAGLVIYFIAMQFSRSARQEARAASSARRRRETRLKVQADASQAPSSEPEAAFTGKQALGTIHASDFNKETVLSQGSPAPAEMDFAIPIQHLFSVIHGPDQGKQFRVDDFPAQIGRDLNSSIRLEADDGVSRQHALIYMINGALRIRDLQSMHGTWVNGRPIMDQVLEPGDQIEVGLSSVLYEPVKKQDV